MSEQGVRQGVSVLGGAVSLGALFPPEWMDEYTEYRDVETFLAAGDGPTLAPGSDRSGPSDEHVAATTTFDDWATMLGAALENYRDRTATSLPN